MTDRVLVFTPSGRLLDELSVSITRAWKASRTIEAARGQFDISTSNEKATSTNLRYGNIILVQSSTGVQDWAGIIWPPTRVKNGVITVQLKSIEYIFSTRITGKTDAIEGTPEEIFAFLVGLAASDNFLYPLGTAVIEDSTGEDKTKKDFHYCNIYDELNKLANDTYHYWWLTPGYSAGVLQFIPTFQSKIGRNFAEWLIENDNFNDVEIVEKADFFANTVLAWGSVGNDDELCYEASNSKAAAIYGKIEMSVSVTDIDTQAGIQTAAESKLLDYAYPLLELTGVVTVLPFPRVGDTVTVVLSTAGSFLVERPSRRAGFQAFVVNASYSPEADEMYIVAREIPEA